MGFSPSAVGRCSPWHLMAALDGYGRSQGWETGPTHEPMSVERLRALGIEDV